jgi:hypothetical protein
MQAAAHFSIHRNGIYLPFIQAQMAVPIKTAAKDVGDYQAQATSFSSLHRLDASSLG